MHFPDSSRIDEINWRVTAARRDVVEGGVCSLAEASTVMTKSFFIFLLALGGDRNVLDWDDRRSGQKRRENWTK
jgi:hypothetical protein